MQIIVLNGSPKGDTSVTMQYVAFVQKKFPQHEFRIVNITQQLKTIENSRARFDEIMEDITRADAVLWAFPLYIFLVHAQYKRFIELISERKAERVFQGKSAAILTTSIHFYDHTAHNYMHGLCDDWDMNFYGSYSAGMQDLFKDTEREKLIQFFQGVFQAIDRRAFVSKVYQPIVSQESEYLPQLPPPVVASQGKKIVIITDAQKQQINLNRMVIAMQNQFSGQAEVINLHDIDIKGGCLGCIHCGYDNTCIYNGKDGFVTFYNNKLKTADILIFAGAIHDRYLSSLWKNFFDRAFFNTHIPSLRGKQLVFLISGPLGQLPNLRQIIEAYSEWQEANLAGIVTDEISSAQIDQAIQELAIKSLEYADVSYIKPATFLGVSAVKIFRDEIGGSLRFPFVADYNFYKGAKNYAFPKQDYSSSLRNLVISVMIKFPSIRKKIYGQMMITKMIEPYKKLLSKL